MGASHFLQRYNYSHIAWSQGPHLGFSAHEHVGPMWKANVGFVNFAHGARHDSTHGQED